jgi:hypothetical protein
LERKLLLRRENLSAEEETSKETSPRRRGILPHKRGNLFSEEETSLQKRKTVLIEEEIFSQIILTVLYGEKTLRIFSRLQFLGNI